MSRSPFDTLRETRIIDSPSSPTGFTGSSRWSDDDSNQWDEVKSKGEGLISPEPRVKRERDGSATPEPLTMRKELSSVQSHQSHGIEHETGSRISSTALFANSSIHSLVPRSVSDKTRHKRPIERAGQRSQLASILQDTWGKTNRDQIVQPVQVSRKRSISGDLPPISTIPTQHTHTIIQTGFNVATAPSGANHFATHTDTIDKDKDKVKAHSSEEHTDAQARLNQAHQAMEILGKILEKITNGQTSLLEENKRLKEGLPPNLNSNQPRILQSNSVRDHHNDNRNGSGNDYENENVQQMDLKWEIEKLTNEKDNLERELSFERARHLITTDKLDQLRSETRISKNDGNMMMTKGKESGISKMVITELAIKLIEQGPSASTSVAGLLLDEVARVGSKEQDEFQNWQYQRTNSSMEWKEGWSIPRDNNREFQLAPTQRLRNLEGVMDVTLGRVENLEKDVKRMKGF